MIISKFGGTSVQDADAIGRLTEIIRRRLEESPVVVVSALAGVTDELLRVGGLVSAGNRDGAKATILALVERHMEVANGLPKAREAGEWVLAEGAKLLSELSPAFGRALVPREQDALMGRGELWSSRIVTAALQGAGVEAVWVDARRVIVTDDRFGRATPLMDRLHERARDVFDPLLNRRRVPVTQGFIGATADGTPTTLGRGGSDFTAALLGAALGAARVEIWTDVDGLMTADPRIVPTAQTLTQASYEEAAELATFGAKVLHPATQTPLERAGIPIAVLNSQCPERPGTLIAPEARLDPLGDSPVRSISWKKGITVINVRAPRMLGAYGFLRALFEMFERHEVPVDVLSTSEISVSLTIEDRTRLPALRRDLETLGEVTVEDGRAIIAVVGIGIRHTPGIAARVFGSVTPANVEIISQGASSINMTFVVREPDGPDIVRRLHREFFGGD